jgi:hypothetical protein
MHASTHPPFAEPILRYMADCRHVQSELTQVLTQMAGFALLLTTRRTSLSLWSGPLQLAGDRMKEAMQALRLLHAPSEAAHHYHHLTEAAEAIEAGVGVARRCLTRGADDTDRDMLTRLLRSATDHLRVTASLLPGFELVDLGQACCAFHAAAAGQEIKSPLVERGG